MTRIDNVETSTSTSTSTNTEDMPIIQLDVIPESLLSLAKDARYIYLCQQLLHQILEPWSRHPASSISIQEDTWFLSSILYVLLVVVPSGRTLGMEALGLTVAVGPKTSTTRLAKAMLLSISGMYALDRWTRTTPQNQSTNDDRESLRGDERRQIHERLRQQMIQRTGGASTTTTTITTQANPSTLSSPTTNPSEPSMSYSQRLKSLLKACAKSLVDTVATASPEGPHGLTRNNTNGATQSAFSMGMWLMRLHLAHYCITGKYPSWLYRFAGLKLERNAGDMARIPSRPTTHRMVGVVIGVQAAATLFRHMANILSYWMTDRLEQNAAAANNNIESRPSIFPTPTNTQVSSSTKESSTCAICRMPRTHPAAPSSCGHVCCWNCLMQWVSVVRPECPLCRTHCRPQDIICLYDYEQQPSED